MIKKFWIGKFLILTLLGLVMLSQPTWGQEIALGPKPVMENVFFNVVWGSAFGIIMGAAITVIEAKDKTAPEGMRDRAYRGATWGGLIGLGAGIYLASSGISYDPNNSLYFTNFSTVSNERSLAPNPLPFALETFSQRGLKITGLQATVLDLKF